MAMIVAEHLSKYYAGHRAIDDVSFSIKEGEIVGLLGLNGAGKSTILKILGCFLMPSAGSARVAGHSVDGDPQAIRRLIGYLPDRPPLYDEMTVKSYLAYVAKLKNVPAGEVARRVENAMAKTNTTEVATVRLSELSHGFRQRVGIGQALVHNPPVLILDEPINGLDPVQIVEMRDLITSLRGKHTVVLSSHILSEITRTCHRILIVDHGRLVAEADLSMETSRLTVDVERVPDGLIDKLKALPGVNGAVLDGARLPGGATRLVVNAEDSVRTALAQAVVQSGAGLVGLARAEGSLEGLFMKHVLSAGNGNAEVS